LTRAVERSYELPFCQLLTAEGHQIIHLSRHGSYEEGKDIISIAPDGTPCAFQLKDEKITLKFWESELNQIRRLVEVPIRHPSIDATLPRRVFLVTSKQLDEEVRFEIEGRNLQWQQYHYPKLETIVRGQLLTRFTSITTNLWPIQQLLSEKTLLEFFLSKGDDCLDKAKLANFITSLLPIWEEQANPTEISRLLPGVALVVSYALSPYVERKNHVAIAEGWLVFAASLIALVTKYQVETPKWKQTFDVALFGIEEALHALCEELKTRSTLVQGHALADTPFYRGRTTWIIGLVSAFALWKLQNNPTSRLDEWYQEFVESHKKYMELWGEGAIPQYLAMIWFLRKTVSTQEPAHWLKALLEAICNFNAIENINGLANPYMSLEEVIAERNELSEHSNRERYAGRSYTLETLLHLYVRRNYKQSVTRLWRRITKVEFAEFIPDEVWQTALWHCADCGILEITVPKLTQSWSELRETAATLDVSFIPPLFQENPALLLFFIIAYPHRLNKNIGKFLDNSFRRTF
jgi:hypothetical protein